MTIIATAPVPSHLNLREAVTGTMSALPVLPVLAPAQRALTAGWFASKPVAELAEMYRVDVDTAARIRTSFAGSLARDARTKPIQGLRQVANDPDAALTNPSVRTTIRRALADGVVPIDIATMVGVSVAALLAALADQDG